MVQNCCLVSKPAVLSFTRLLDHLTTFMSKGFTVGQPDTHAYIHAYKSAYACNMCLCVSLDALPLLEAALTETRRYVFGVDRCGHLLLSLRRACKSNTVNTFSVCPLPNNAKLLKLQKRVHCGDRAAGWRKAYAYASPYQ